MEPLFNNWQEYNGDNDFNASNAFGEASTSHPSQAS